MLVFSNMRTLDLDEINSWLSGCPYSINEDHRSLGLFREAHKTSAETQKKASQTLSRIERDAGRFIEPFRHFLRSDLVAESNRIEGYEWSAEQVRAAALMHEELLNASTHVLMTALQGDTRVLEALGLYRAHALADTWTSSPQRRPCQAEIRALHAEVAAGFSYAGDYKKTENSIGGSELKTTAPHDVHHEMHGLTDWWQRCGADPVLRATVVHAWLTHIHPFEDGNGRMARLLANLELAQSGYPPMILREQADRGRYYDALAESDDGNILPLYGLFAQVLRRTVETMSMPAYISDIVQERFLQTEVDRYTAWQHHLDVFTEHVTEQFSKYGWRTAIQGTPDLESFSLLVQRNSSGNCWYLKTFDRREHARWLLWFGYPSVDMSRSVVGHPLDYPSIFLSFRDLSATAIHPYKMLARSGHRSVPSEVSLMPGTAISVALRWNEGIRQCSTEEAAKILVHSVVNDTTLR